GGPAPGECPPDGVRITAPAGAVTNGFAQTELRVPAGERLVVCFDNQDAGIPHNVAIHAAEDFSDQAIAATTPEPGPVTQTLEVPALDPGTYYFRCDVHPTTMTGTLVAR
ncbi:MAG TPA: cupredoxin domain-containing protein, partial [Actinomycetota bacterium]|nr:cupredoxin domain-containing protein [Actinomycetota bacterium]